MIVVIEKKLSSSLVRTQYLGADIDNIRPGFIDPYTILGTGEEPEQLLRYNQFFIEQSTCPGRIGSLVDFNPISPLGI